MRSPAWLFGVCLLFACSKPTPETRPAAVTSNDLSLDFGKLMRTAHFAYRPEGDGFVGKHATYRVRTDASGFAVTPSANHRTGSPVHFTTTLRRGSESLGSKAKARVEDDGTLAVDRGDVIERLHDDERGVEQTWTFAHAPGGIGDLVVHLDVGDARPVLGASGAHFAANGELSLAYGNATFVDAKGVRTSVPVRVVEHGLELSVPAEVLAHAAYPAVLDPVISPEITWDKTVEITPPGLQQSPDIACSTTNCLVVWSSDRRDEGDVFGARIDKTGAILDPHGLGIGLGITTEGNAKVAWDGTNYVVLYEKGLDFTSSTATGVALARVASTGALVGTTTSSGTRPQKSDDVACGGGVCLNVFTESTGAVRGVRYSSAGAALDTTPLTLGTVTAGTNAHPVVAFGSSEFMVVWSDLTKLHTTRVTAAGAVLDTTSKTPFTSAGNQTSPAIAASATGFFVSWTDNRVDPPDLYGARLDPANTTTDATGIAIRKGTNLESLSSVAFDGTSWVVTWNDAVPRSSISNALAARVSTAGKLLDTTPIALTTSNMGAEPTIASDGTQSYVVYRDDTSVLIRRLDNAGKILDTPGKVISKAVDMQISPAVSWSGTQWLVAWTDQVGPQTLDADVMASRVDATGKILDTTGLVLSALGNVHQDKVAVASDGTGWLVVWEDGRPDPDFLTDIYGTRVSATGTVLDPSSLRLTKATDTITEPCLDFDGTNYQLGFTLGVNGVAGVRVSKTGVPLDSTPQNWLPAAKNACAIAFDGVNHLVVGSDPPGNGKAEVMGVRVAKTGAATGASFVVSSAPGDQYGARVAWDGAQYLVAWSDARSGTHVDVYGARVSSTGALLDASGLLFAGGAGNQLKPDVGYDGASFFVTWMDDATGQFDVFAASVAPSGVLRGAPFAVANTTDHETSPRVSASSKSRRLVLYSRFDTATSFVSQRVRGRVVDGLPSGQTCTGATDCLSGICVDGVCCDKACTGQCEACNVAGKEGFCTPVVGAPKAPRAACSGPGTGTLCAPRCDGVDTTKCTYAPADTVACSVASCASGIETHAAFCNGSGVCADTPKTCGAYACGTTACNTTCVTAADCATGYTCEASTCVPKPGLGKTCTDSTGCEAGLFCVSGVCCGSASCGAGESCGLAGSLGSCRKIPGATCSIDAECGSSHCVDNVCCESACTGQCEACDGVEKGKCLPVAGKPHGMRKACDVGASVCEEAACDGAKDATKCVGFAKGAETPCSVSRCEGEKFYAVTSCTGGGACSPQVEQSCVPYTCDATGCRKSCSAPEHCAAGFSCREGSCQAVGTRCTDDGLSVVSADGSSVSCVPYVCKGGTCASSCASNADCNVESVCNADGRCVPRPAPAGVEDGSGCTAAPRPLKNGAWMIAALVAVSLLRRRRSA